MAETLFSSVPSPTAMAPGLRGRTDTGTRVRTTRSTDSPRERSSSRKPLVIDARTTSLKAPPESLADPLDVVHRGGRPCIPAVGADRAVEAGDRRGSDQARHRRQPPAPPPQPTGERMTGHPGAGPHRPELFVRAPGQVGGGPDGQSDAARCRSRDPNRPPIGGDGRGRRVHDHRQQVGPRHPVDHGVMGLGEQGPAPSSRPSTIQISHSGLDRSSCWAMTRPTRRAQLGLAPGRGQGGVAEVVVDVEVLVVHPHRPAQVERDEADHLAVAGNERKLARDHVHDVGVARSRPLEDPDGGDVHMAHVVLDMQERRIEWAQPVKAHGPPSFACRRRAAYDQALGDPVVTSGPGVRPCPGRDRGPPTPDSRRL